MRASSECVYSAHCRVCTGHVK
uniref:Uncharacterized protein n=1 Tax=Anguilla anguilla TaxID=7936 RepID=A0A0E9UWE9_ANGAN